MASPEVEESSGKETPEYKKVLSKIPEITSTLKQLPGAKEQLSELYKKHKWIAMETNATETNLVNIALERIQLKSGQFELFVGMLKEITGMDLIVQNLELTGESLYHTSDYPYMAGLFPVYRCPCRVPVRAFQTLCMPKAMFLQYRCTTGTVPTS